MRLISLHYIHKTLLNANRVTIWQQHVKRGQPQGRKFNKCYCHTICCQTGRAINLNYENYQSQMNCMAIKMEAIKMEPNQRLDEWAQKTNLLQIQPRSFTMASRSYKRKKKIILINNNMTGNKIFPKRLKIFFFFFCFFFLKGFISYFYMQYYIR